MDLKLQKQKENSFEELITNMCDSRQLIKAILISSVFLCNYEENQQFFRVYVSSRINFLSKK
jgi:hypothetical protein